MEIFNINLKKWLCNLCIGVQQARKLWSWLSRHVSLSEQYALKWSENYCHLKISVHKQCTWFCEVSLMTLKGKWWLPLVLCTVVLFPAARCLLNGKALIAYEFIHAEGELSDRGQAVLCDFTVSVLSTNLGPITFLIFNRTPWPLWPVYRGSGWNLHV